MRLGATESQSLASAFWLSTANGLPSSWRIRPLQLPFSPFHAGKGPHPTSRPGGEPPRRVVSYPPPRGQAQWPGLPCPWASGRPSAQHSPRTGREHRPAETLEASLCRESAECSTRPSASAKARNSFLCQIFSHGLRTLLVLFSGSHIRLPRGSHNSNPTSPMSACPNMDFFLPSGREVSCLREYIAESPHWWPRQISRAETLFLQDLQTWVAEPTSRVTDPAQVTLNFHCRECKASFPRGKHLHAHMANAHRIYSPANQYTLSPACIACLKLYGSIQQSQQHLKRSPPCLCKAVHLVPPLSYAQILELEALRRPFSAAC